MRLSFYADNFNRMAPAEPSGIKPRPTGGKLRRLPALILLATLMGSAPVHANAWSNNEPMFLTWMRWMALWLGMDPSSSGFSSPGMFAGGMNPMMMNSYAGPYSNLMQTNNWQNLQPWQIPQQSDKGSSHPLIDGTWRGPNRLTLNIKGERMRLSVPGGQPVNGELIVRGKYFIVYRPAADGLEVYEYMLQGNRLWLIDGDNSRLFERYVARGR